MCEVGCWPLLIIVFYQVEMYRTTKSRAICLKNKSDGTRVNVFNDPLPRWKERNDRFPIVATIPRRVFTISATSEQPLWLFSAAGQIVMKCRRCCEKATSRFNMKRKWKKEKGKKDKNQFDVCHKLDKAWPFCGFCYL